MWSIWNIFGIVQQKLHFDIQTRFLDNNELLIRGAAASLHGTLTALNRRQPACKPINARVSSATTVITSGFVTISPMFVHLSRRVNSIRYWKWWWPVDENVINFKSNIRNMCMKAVVWPGKINRWIVVGIKTESLLWFAIVISTIYVWDFIRWLCHLCKPYGTLHYIHIDSIIVLVCPIIRLDEMWMSFSKLISRNGRL